MSQIEELQGRITSALDRISQGLDLQANAKADPAELEDLKQSLEEERTAGQQLEERNKALHERIEALEAQLEELQNREPAVVDAPFPDVFAQFGDALAQAREANHVAVSSNEKLRAAHAERTGDVALINDAMAAQIDSLKAAQELDRAEMAAILEALDAALGAGSGSQNVEETV